MRKGGHGYLSMREAIIQSCNVYFYHLGNDMGIERISKWAHRLGFGEPTGIDLPHEEAGTVPDPDWKRRAVPRDPFLLRHLGKGDLWVVVAMWNLTEVERAALQARA